MRENPERLAWTVLVLSFGACCLLAVLVPLAIRSYLLYASDAQVTAVTSIRSTVLAETGSASLPIPITDGNTAEVEEGARISTDATSQAILSFFNDSAVTMYGLTSLRIQSARSPRFGLSPEPDTIVVQVESGRIRVVPAQRSNPESGRGLRFEVHTPQAYIQLSEGSFSVEIADDETLVTARQGEARLQANSHEIVLATGERAVVKAGQSPSSPLPAERNLLSNGDFLAGLEDSWQAYRVEPPGGVVTASLRVVTDEFETGLQLLSAGKDNLHSEVGVKQPIDKSVQDFESLRIQLNVRLVFQSLPGGGTLGSEFPLMVHLAYKDAEGNDRDWYHGFYYTSPPENWMLPATSDNSSERIARFLWYPYESPNLLDTLGAGRPVYLKYLRIYASGWLYESYVADVRVLAQE